LFKNIATEVTRYDRFFEQRRNAAGELNHSTYQKVTIVLRMLAYGIPADLIDDHLAMGESTSILCVKRFAVAIVIVFGSTHFKTRQDFWSSTPTEDFQVCLAPLIVCIGVGRIVQRHGMDNSKGTIRIPLQSLKRSPIMRLGYGMHFLECPGLAMTSMFFNGHH
jgi:hypothetical protein